MAKDLFEGLGRPWDIEEVKDDIDLDQRFSGTGNKPEENGNPSFPRRITKTVRFGFCAFINSRWLGIEGRITGFRLQRLEIQRR